MDSNIIQDQIDGLIEKGKELRKKEKIFLKASGLNESIEKLKAELVTLEANIETEKEQLAELKAKKSEALKNTLMAMQDKITELLPMGDGIVHIEDDGSLAIGWLLPGKAFVRYDGLSGGQKVIFGEALGNALLGDASKFIIYEAAEVEGYDSLPALLKQIKKTQSDTQIIVNTWFKPKTIPKGWNLIELNEQ